MVGVTERGEYLILVRAIWTIVTTEVVYTHSSGQFREEFVSYHSSQEIGFFSRSCVIFSCL